MKTIDTSKLNALVEAQRIVLDARFKAYYQAKQSGNLESVWILNSAFEYLQEQINRTINVVCESEASK